MQPLYFCLLILTVPVSASSSRPESPESMISQKLRNARRPVEMYVTSDLSRRESLWVK